ncbi:MAG: transposase [Deltaproteobacteria bacterium]|jgi:hypothetical protein|nr:transposase [Deltaproteobacteria bacterium]
MAFLYFGKITNAKGITYHYIWECTAFRTSSGTTNSKKNVGHYDPIEKIAYFNNEYLEKHIVNGELDIKVPEGYSIANKNDFVKLYSKRDISLSNDKELGCFYLLKEIANNIGLVDCLSSVLPFLWQKVIMLSFFLLSTNDPFQHCSDWINATDGFNVGDMSSQHISHLLSQITKDQRSSFYDKWAEYNLNEKYLAICIASKSSYLELIDNTEYDDNICNNQLTKDNICILMDHSSLLPISIVNYPKSSNDVNVLDKTIKNLSSITNTNELSLILDKEFYYEENINFLLKYYPKVKFIISLPFTSSLANEQLLKYKDNIVSPKNVFQHNETALFSKSESYLWDLNNNINIFNYYNLSKNSTSRLQNYNNALELFNKASIIPIKYINNMDYCKYLDFKKDNETNLIEVTMSNEKILQLSQFSGWLTLITNDDISFLDAINIYRHKYIIEKCCLNLKRNHQLDTNRSKSQNTIDNIFFISFISLILVCKIHQVMFNTDLYKKYSIATLLNTLKSFKKRIINDDIIYNTITNEQNEIFKAFGIDIDDGIIL